VLQNYSWGPGKILDFLPVKEWEPCLSVSGHPFSSSILFLVSAHLHAPSVRIHKMLTLTIGTARGIDDPVVTGRSTLERDVKQQYDALRCQLNFVIAGDRLSR